MDARDGAMMTPLMWAAFHGHQDHVIKLIERGAVPDITDIDGMTAAHWAIQRHDTRTLQILINTESASYHDNKGKTVMHQAAERVCVILRILLYQLTQAGSLHGTHNDCFTG